MTQPTGKDTEKELKESLRGLMEFAEWHKKTFKRIDLFEHREPSSHNVISLTRSWYFFNVDVPSFTIAKVEANGVAEIYDDLFTLNGSAYQLIKEGSQIKMIIRSGRDGKPTTIDHIWLRVPIRSEPQGESTQP